MGYINRPVTSIYTRRSFSDKFSATTEFLSANWCSLLRYIILFMLPVCLVQTFCVDKYMEASLHMGDETFGFVLYYLLLLAFSTIGGYLMALIVYSLIRIHHHMTGSADADASETDAETEGGATKRYVSWTQMRPLFKAQAIPLLKATAAGVIYLIAMGLVFVAIVALSALGSIDAAMIVGILLFIVFMVFSIAILSMLIPIFEFENPDIIPGLKQAARYGLNSLGGILGLCVVFGIIVSVIGGLLSVPYFVFFFMKVMFVVGNDEQFAFANAPWFLFAQYILGVVYLLANYLLSSTLIVAMIYQYGHAKEKLDGASDEELTTF